MRTNVCLIVLILTSVSADYKTLSYNGFNYTYAGEEARDYAGTIAWCTRLGGQLPSIHSQQDIEFLADVLVGRHRNYESIFLGATQHGDNWSWDDGSQFNSSFPKIDVNQCESHHRCCGLHMWTDVDTRYHRKVWSSDFCRSLAPKRRMVCVTRGSTSPTGPTSEFTTPSPFLNLSQPQADSLLDAHHNEMREGLSELSDRLQLLSESIPNELDHTLRHNGLKQRLEFLKTQIVFLTTFIIMAFMTFVAVRSAALVYRMRYSATAGQPVSLSDLLYD